MPRIYTRKPLEQRLLESITKDDSGCWIWNKSLTAYGYGQISIPGGSPTQAHRLAYRLFVGDPGDMCVLHKCDNPKCCNPEHLFLGTRTDNASDKVSKGRQARGEDFAHAKLTEEDAKAIRIAILLPRKQLAGIYGVNVSTICRIQNGQRWSYLSE